MSVSSKLHCLNSTIPRAQFLPPRTEEVNAISRDVCMSVCLSVSKITQNACMDLDDIFRVDRCRDMDELVNF